MTSLLAPIRADELGGPVIEVNLSPSGIRRPSSIQQFHHGGIGDALLEGDGQGFGDGNGLMQCTPSTNIPGTLLLKCGIRILLA